MSVTIEVPKNRLRPILRLGFLISPAINVTLFQESLLNIEPTIAAATAPKAAIIVYCEKLPSPFNFWRFQALLQLAFHISGFMASNPNRINANRLNNLVKVKVVCITLP